MKKTTILEKIKEISNSPQNSRIKDTRIRAVIEDELSKNSDNLFNMALKAYKKLDKENPFYSSDRKVFLEYAITLLHENNDSRLLNYIIKGE